MGKYNLIDIYEQYQIGSGWTNDFDYDGMLNAGLNVSVDTNIETLKKIVEDFTDVNYHREASHLYDAIEAIEGGDMFEAEGKLNDFFAEIRKTQETLGMDMSDDLGAYMASKMEEKEEKKLPMDENEEAVDLAIETSQEKAGINEARIDREVAERIEGMLSIPLKRKFLDSFMDLWQDLIEEDPFYAEDVINHLNNEMHREIDGYQAMGDKLAGMDQLEEDGCEKHDYKQIDPDGTAECTKCGLRNSDPSKTGEKVRSESKGVDFIRALKVDANGTSLEIKSYLESLKRSGDKFDSVDDYVEDFKNYVADKSLQEHFGRFMKDYQ